MLNPKYDKFKKTFKVGDIISIARDGGYTTITNIAVITSIIDVKNYVIKVTLSEPIRFYRDQISNKLLFDFNKDADTSEYINSSSIYLPGTIIKINGILLRYISEFAYLLEK